ncbi:MAG: PrsW family intramembrane metalloprotease [Oscillibacter sp.]|nr:PrsW family intramembrane metalloprotease [Oscillibacter sp.]
MFIPTFQFSPVLPVALIYILAAVLPAAVLLRYIYCHDTVEPEPPGLLFLLLLSGVLAALLASVLEGIGEAVLKRFFYQGDPLYPVLLAFLVVAVIEEGVKFFFLKRRTWNHPAFNYRFDGVVYSAFVSLGFAAFENVYYIFGYGLSVAVPRALLAIPGHLSFSVFMGMYYGRARLRENRGHHVSALFSLWAGYLIAVFLHGVYDACAMSGTAFATGLFVVFVLLMFAAAWRTIKRESETDRPIVRGL